MRKLLCAAGVCLALAMSAGAYADKVAVVNMGEIFQNTPSIVSTTKQLESEFRNRTSELQNLEKDLQSAMQKFQRDNATMSPSDREKQEKQLIAKRDTFAQKAQKFEEDKRRRQDEERSKIFNRIQNAIKVVAAKEGYDVVIDQNVVMYSKDTFNITSQVQQQVK